MPDILPIRPKNNLLMTIEEEIKVQDAGLLLPQTDE